MGKYFNRLSTVIDVINEQDKAITESKTLTEAKTAIETANFFNLRTIAINTAIIADVLDRISTDRKDTAIDDLIKMIEDI